jgi:hypothetical protein
MTDFFVIRNKNGEFYKPTYHGNVWKPTMKKGKVYTNISHAKCAITTKLDHYNNLSTYKWLNPSKSDLDMYSKFKDCEIVKIGEMNGINEEIVYTQK